MFGKLIEIIQTAIAALADGELTQAEAAELLEKLAGLVKAIGGALGEAPLQALIIGIGELLDGIAAIVSDPDGGLDELLDGLADALKGAARYVEG